MVKRLLERLFFVLYDIIFSCVFLLYLPVYFWRKKITLPALKEKLGIISGLNIKDSIWIQVVSVGEVNLIENLIKRLKEIYNYPIVISTTTLTGKKIATQKYSSMASVIFFPFDLSFVIRRIIRMIEPKVFIAVETEIWPNLFYCLKERNVPIAIINGRISDRAFKRYKPVRLFLRHFLDKCDHIGVQNETYKERFHFLGADSAKVVISGNMKFESIAVDANRLFEVKNAYLAALKKDDRLILIAASTHFPEEEIIVEIYKDILSKTKNITLVIAPRHPHRTASVEKTISSSGFNPVRLSSMYGYSRQESDIFIIDTVGQLLYFYSLADICFVGGSLAPYGGHNILEPIYFLKPTVFGPHMSNFRDIESAVLERQAAIRVNDSQELRQRLLEMVKSHDLRDSLRSRCLQVFESQKASLDQNIQIIVKCIDRK